MASGNQRYLVYIESFRIYFYSVQMEQAIAVDLPQTAVRDLEILNREQVYAVVDTLLTQNGITGGSALFVLAPSLVFEKQIVQDLSDEARRTAAIKEYIDNVPFEQTAYVSYPIETGIGVIAANEEFFGTIKKAFEKKHINVSLILPVRSFGEIQIPPSSGPDPQTAAYLLQNADQLKQFAFHLSLPPAVKPSNDNGPKLKITNGPPSKKLPIYLSVFGLLILVLAIMLVMSNQPPINKPIATNANAEAPPAAAGSEPPPAAAPQPSQEASAAATLDKSLVKIQIKTPTLFRTRVDDMKAQLTAAGYSAVDIVESPPAESTVLLLDKTTLTDEQRAAIVTELKTYIPNFSVQEVEGAQYSAQLVIGNSF